MSSRGDYTARVANSVDEVTVSDTPTDNAGGVVVAAGTPATCDTTATITHNAKVSLTPGSVTNICVLVTAEDDTAKMVYTIDVYRERANASDNADLTIFRIDEATGTVNITTGVNTVTAVDTQMVVSSPSTPDVPYRVREVTVVADPSDDGSIVSITPADSDAERSGHQVALAEGVGYGDYRIGAAGGLLGGSKDLQHVGLSHERFDKAIQGRHAEEPVT